MSSYWNQTLKQFPPYSLANPKWNTQRQTLCTSFYLHFYSLSLFFFSSSFSSRKDRSTCCLRQMRKKYAIGYFEEFIGTENTSLVNYSRHLCFRSFCYCLLRLIIYSAFFTPPHLMEIRGIYHSYFWYNFFRIKSVHWKSCTGMM